MAYSSNRNVDKSLLQRNPRFRPLQTLFISENLPFSLANPPFPSNFQAKKGIHPLHSPSPHHRILYSPLSDHC